MHNYSTPATAHNHKKATPVLSDTVLFFRIQKGQAQTQRFPSSLHTTPFRNL